MADRYFPSAPMVWLNNKAAANAAALNDLTCKSIRVNYSLFRQIIKLFADLETNNTTDCCATQGTERATVS